MCAKYKKTTYYPSPNKRKQPDWIPVIHSYDRVLGNVIDEVYLALDNDLFVLAAIGIRTCIDRASERLGVAPHLKFYEKLNEMLSSGFIGSGEKDALSVLVDAGSAAAHRGWQPAPDDIGTMMDAMEGLIHRNIVLPEGIKLLTSSIPDKKRK